MEATSVDLFAFGNNQQPRLPRMNIDIFPDRQGMIGPEDPKNPQGGSLFADPLQANLGGYYYLLPAGTALPEGLALIADGVDVDPTSPHGATHHTLYPKVGMAADRFLELFKSLPWRKAGKK